MMILWRHRFCAFSSRPVLRWLGGALLCALVPVVAHGEPVSSHDAALFDRLLSGRVLIALDPVPPLLPRASKGARVGRPSALLAAVVFGANHQARACLLALPPPGITQQVLPAHQAVMHWEVREDAFAGSRLGLSARPDGTFSTPLTWHPDSGWVYGWQAGVPWHRVLNGWLQRAVPARFAAACPDLLAGGGLALNRDQQTLDLADLKAKGHLVTRADLTDVPQPLHGETLIEDPARAVALLRTADGALLQVGPHLYGTLYAARSELWLSPYPDRVGAIVDVRLAPDDGPVTLSWHDSARREVIASLMDGFHLMYHPTGRRHPLRALLDRLTDRPLILPTALSAHKLILKADGEVAGPGSAVVGHWELDGETVLLTNGAGRMDSVDVHDLAALNAVGRQPDTLDAGDSS